MKLSRKMLRTVVAVGMTVTVLTSGASGLVLCIGHNGHLAIASAGHGCCHDDSAADGTGNNHSTPQKAISAEAEGCSMCIDLGLGPEHTLQFATRISPSRVLPIAPSGLVHDRLPDRVALRNATPPRHPTGAFSVTHHLLVQRSIVLRT